MVKVFRLKLRPTNSRIKTNTLKIRMGSCIPIRCPIISQLKVYRPDLIRYVILGNIFVYSGTSAPPAGKLVIPFPILLKIFVITIDVTNSVVVIIICSPDIFFFVLLPAKKTDSRKGTPESEEQ